MPLGECSTDEGPREPNWEKIRSLPTLTEGGRVTAACASQISDASAALLVVSEQGLKDHGLTPRARIHHLSVRGDDPVWMLTAPIPATRVRPREDRHDPRRHRPGRDQRGLRLGRAGLGQGARRRPGQGQRQRRRHRPRPPARRHRCPPDDHAAQRARAHGWPLRPPDHVRGRRPGQRHHHRAACNPRSGPEATVAVGFGPGLVSRSQPLSSSGSRRRAPASCAR